MNGCPKEGFFEFSASFEHPSRSETSEIEMITVKCVNATQFSVRLNSQTTPNDSWSLNDDTTTPYLTGIYEEFDQILAACNSRVLPNYPILTTSSEELQMRSNPKPVNVKFATAMRIQSASGSHHEDEDAQVDQEFNFSVPAHCEGVHNKLDMSKFYITDYCASNMMKVEIPSSPSKEDSARPADSALSRRHFDSAGTGKLSPSKSWSTNPFRNMLSSSGEKEKKMKQNSLSDSFDWKRKSCNTEMTDDLFVNELNNSPPSHILRKTATSPWKSKKNSKDCKNNSVKNYSFDPLQHDSCLTQESANHALYLSPPKETKKRDKSKHDNDGNVGFTYSAKKLQFSYSPNEHSISSWLGSLIS